MFLMTENKGKKELTVYVYSDDYGNDLVHPWCQSEIKRYTEMGYAINSVVFPLISDLPKEIRKVYNAVYQSKAILDTLISVAKEDVLADVLAQIVRQEFSKYSIEDIAASVVDYEKSVSHKI